MEKWKVILDSDGHYFISNKGKMKREEYSFYSKSGKLQKRNSKVYSPIFNKKNGYYSYKYRDKNGNSIGQYCHRLIATHFIENKNPLEFNEVNHIDGNKCNNSYENLEWCNKKMNMEHASLTNLINRDSEKRKEQTKINQRNSIHKLYKKVVEYDENGKLVAIHDSYNKIKTEGNNKSSSCDHRLTYKNHYFRDYNVFMGKYGTIPFEINITRIQNIRNCKRKNYSQYKDGLLINTYEKLEDLPITREKLWYLFNHEIEDENGFLWKIENK